MNNDYFVNPKAFVIKKWMSQLIGEATLQHQDIIDKIGTSLTNQKELEAFSKLLGAAYEAGFYKCVADYKKEFARNNIQIKVTSESIDAIHS